MYMRKLNNILRKLKKIFCKQKFALLHEGEEGILKLGHREYVGGMWDQIGKLQFNFMVEQGLRPAHCFLDIGCGCLRGGRYFIKYLDKGNYLGIDKENKLIEIGITKEVGDYVYKDKEPQFVVSDCFEFEKFSKKPQFSLAHSLFTHLNQPDIKLCLSNLRKFIDNKHVLFATFFEGHSGKNVKISHSLKGFNYSRREMERFGYDEGWVSTYIGDWMHPRNQKMIKYEAR
jgi:SAM-dependent methyltransferase